MAGCADPWLILTDLPASAADPCWYAMRSWIEQGFKVVKSGGWQWHRTRMTAPDRAERLWVAVAVATVCQIGERDGIDPGREGPPRAAALPAGTAGKRHHPKSVTPVPR